MRTFKVKNFERFQHYRDRSPPWIKLYNSLLDDYAFTRLQDASKAHLLAIFLLASRYENAIPCDILFLSSKIGATEKIDLGALQKAGFIICDDDLSYASNTLAERKQDARPEREAEREAEREERESRVPRFSRLKVNGWDSEFAEFWAAYPRHDDRKKAYAAYGKALKAADHRVIIEGAQRYCQDPNREPAYTKQAATWLRAESWANGLLPERNDPQRKLANIRAENQKDDGNEYH